VRRVLVDHRVEQLLAAREVRRSGHRRGVVRFAP
jgi:hypothetical protein